MENEEKVIKKINKLLNLIKIIRNDFLMIDINGQIYKISETDYYILSLIKNVKNYEKIKQLLKGKFQSEKELEIFINQFLDKYINALSGKNNNIYNQEEEIKFFEENKALKSPLVVSLQLLESCNLKCKHCYTSAKNEKYKAMNFEDVKQIIEQLNQLKIFRLGLTGGETLLYKELEHVIELASQYHIITTITTNGILLTKEKALNLKRSGINHIHISIDGDREIHNKIRENNISYDKAIEAIEICKNVGLPVEINYTIMKSNINCLQNMIALAKKYDIQINVRRLIPTGRGKEKTKELINYKECKNVLKEIQKSDYHKIKLDYCFFNINQYRGNCKTNNKCILTINSKGDVYTCPYLQYDEFVIGNIKKENLKEIYSRVEKSKLVNFNKNMLKYPCNECEKFMKCYGGCRANAYILYNDLYDLDIQCEKCYQVKLNRESKNEIKIYTKKNE